MCCCKKLRKKEGEASCCTLLWDLLFARSLVDISDPVAFFGDSKVIGTFSVSLSQTILELSFVAEAVNIDEPSKSVVSIIDKGALVNN